MDLAWELKKTMEHESDIYTNCNCCSQYSPHKIAPRTGRLGNIRTCRNHPNDCIIKIVQNTEKSPWYLSRLAVTRTLVRNHRLTLAWKTQMNEINIRDWKKTRGDHQNYNIAEISQNTERSPGDLRRFAVTPTPVESHQLTLVWKIL